MFIDNFPDNTEETKYGIKKYGIILIILLFPFLFD